MDPIVKYRMQEEAERIKQTLQKLPNVRITTMTIGVVLSETFDLKNIDESFHTSRVQDFIKDVMESADAIRLTTGRNFNNSRILKIRFQENHQDTHQGPSPTKHEQAVKIFCNGSLHLTGFKTLEKCLYTAEIVATMLELMQGGPGYLDKFQITNFDVQLINACFQAPIPPNTYISLPDFHRALSAFSDFYTSYNNDHYAGVVLKSPEFTIMTFDSGNIMISSITTMDQLEKAYEYIINFVTKNTAKFMVVDRPKQILKRTDPNFDYGKYIILK